MRERETAGHLIWTAIRNGNGVKKTGLDLTQPRFNKLKSLFLLNPVLDEAVHHRRIGQRRGVAEVLHLVMRDLAEDAAHDLAASGLGQARRELELVRRGDRADDRAHMAGQDLLEVVRRLLAVLQGHVHVDALALDVVGIADHRCLGDRLVADQRGLDLGRAEPVAGDVDDVVDPAHEPVVAVLVHARAVAGEVLAREPAEVDFLDALVLGVAVGAAEHAGPGLLDARGSRPRSRRQASRPL